MKRLLTVLALAGLVIACGDDEGDDDDPGDTGVDSGARDAGGDAGRDGGMDAGMTVTCGGQTCTGHMHPNLGFYAPGCARDYRDAEVCGVSTAMVGGADAGYPAYVQKEAPGEPSTTCAAFFDNQEPPDGGTRGNGRIDAVLRGLPIAPTMSFPVSYPGCCTAAGFCSTDTSMSLSPTSGMTNGGFGCIDSKIAFRAQGAAAQMVPCNPDNGMLLLDAGM